MGAVGVASLSQLDEHAGGGDERAGTGTASAGVASLRTAPLYKRLPHGPHRLTREEVVRNQRTRIHGAMIEAIAQYGYEKTNVKKVVALSGVSRRAFYEHFANKEECFLAAFDEMSDELLTLTADSELVGDDWPRAVRRTIGALMRHLAAHPLHARMIAAEVYAAGPDAIERNHELARDIATLLTEGAPEGTGGMLALEGVRGAIFHTIRSHVANGRIHLLGAFADYLAYVVLAPFIGAESAADLVSEDRVLLDAA